MITGYTLYNSSISHGFVSVTATPFVMQWAARYGLVTINNVLELESHARPFSVSWQCRSGAAERDRSCARCCTETKGTEAFLRHA